MQAAPHPPGSTRRSIAVPVLLLLLAALVGLALVRGRLGTAPSFHGTTYDPPDVAPAFTLTDHTGTERALADYRGRAVLLFFGYTHCPDVCPLTLTRLTAALDELDADPDDVGILLVTVDPERDTPEVLRRYVERFGDEVTGFTGDPAALQATYAAYGIHAAAGHGEATPPHTSAVIGIDREGRRRVLLHGDAPAEELRHDLEILMDL